MQGQISVQEHTRGLLQLPSQQVPHACKQSSSTPTQKLHRQRPTTRQACRACEQADTAARAGMAVARASRAAACFAACVEARSAPGGGGGNKAEADALGISGVRGRVAELQLLGR